ncbi:hypothetical protein [Pelagerythrobacter rhizovicinus]|uniref:Uncharacterized protein n=1 Tax=Pelagerythrobacter rhizovicinus TaxID=2268576 RepID=A0A4Q2KIW3_9SPHN|nr:hypothetical protein [Pelagerythrobacter rhizovicinus]RXZ64237.1 hypothetical protein ETX26_10010 [Pelagerythrobacter rhizovicinus]
MLQAIGRISWKAAAIAVPMASASVAHSQHQSLEEADRERLLGKIAFYIRSNPEAACALPKSEIEQYLSAEANRYGLLDNIGQTVFNEGNAPLTGYAAQLEQIRRETARLSARNRAIYSGQEAPVNDTWQEPAKRFPAQLHNVEAASRIENGLKCIASGRVERLRFPISYIVYLDPSSADGWTAQFVGLPTFTEEAALGEQSTLRVSYGDTFFTLSEARLQAIADRASARVREAELEQRRAEREAYRNSAAGRAEALRQRQAMADKQKACEANGGTWGVRFDDSAIMGVDAQDVDGFLWMMQGCYFLGR